MICGMKKYPIPRMLLGEYLHPADDISVGYCLIPSPDYCPFKQKNYCAILNKVFQVPLPRGEGIVP